MLVLELRLEVAVMLVAMRPVMVMDREQVWRVRLVELDLPTRESDLGSSLQNVDMLGM